MQPGEFWGSNPAEVAAYLEAFAWREKQKRDKAVFLAYHIALLSRAKKIPSLAQLLAGETRPVTGDELKERTAELNELKNIPAPKWGAKA